MAEDWWDTGGGFDLFGGDTLDIGSFNPGDYSLGGGGLNFDFSSIAPTGVGADFDLGFSPGLDTSLGSGGGFGGALGGAMGAVGGVPGLLGLGGGIAGLIGQLAGGGQGQTVTPTLGTAQRAQIGQANQALGPYAVGQAPLQQMQMSLLQALASGQGLPPGYAQLVEQAFQPQMGDLYTQAANVGRTRGFHDAPGTSPPGGAILGPGLANLQGQMAAAKLGLMQSLPNLFNAPIQTGAQAATNQAGSLLNAAQLGRGQVTSQPIGPAIGQAVGAGLQGLGQSMAQSQQQQQMDQLLRQMQSGISLSGQPRY